MKRMFPASFLYLNQPIWVDEHVIPESIASFGRAPTCSTLFKDFVQCKVLEIQEEYCRVLLGETAFTVERTGLFTSELLRSVPFDGLTLQKGDTVLVETDERGRVGQYQVPVERYDAVNALATLTVEAHDEDNGWVICRVGPRTLVRIPDYCCHQKPI